MRQFPKYTDDEHERLEREAEQLIAEAEEALDRARDMFESFGLDEDDARLTEFLSSGGPSEELDALRDEIFDGKDVQDALFVEEKRLRTELDDASGAPAPQQAPRPRRRMTRV